MKAHHLAFHLEFPSEERARLIGIPSEFPLLHWPDGSLCELAFSVFDWLHRYRGIKVGTLKRLAFDLREWLAFCLWHEWKAEQPSDERLASWKISLTDSEDGQLTSGQAQAKTARIFGMYVNLHRAMPFAGDGPRLPVVIVLEKKPPPAPSLIETLCDDKPAKSGADIPRPITEDATRKLTAYRSGKGLRWSGATANGPNGLPRPIPTAKQAQIVLERLRSGIAKEGFADYPSYLAERDWLMGRFQAGAGARAVEVSRAHLDALLAMLAMEGFSVDAALRNNAAGKTAPVGVGAVAPHPLDALAANPTGWKALMAWIEGLDAAGRKIISLPIVGKNDKKRFAPIDLDVVRDLLEVGVASVRRAQLAAWREAGWTGEAPLGLFLSDKTRSALRAGTIADVVKKAFSAKPLVPGAGHRLRAYYAVDTAIRIFGDRLERFQGQMSWALVEAVHTELASALGHSNISITVRFYVQLASAFHGQKTKHRETVLLIIRRELAAQPGELTEAKLRLVVKTIRAVLKAELASDYLHFIDMLPDRFGLDVTRNDLT